MKPGMVYTVSSSPTAGNLKKLLDACRLARELQNVRTILVKPNLVNDLPPPITTPVALVADLIDYLQSISSAEIIIGEGTASAAHDTFYIFSRLGYTEMAKEKGVKLLDLNQEKSICKQRQDCTRWPEMHLPKICYECFLLSVPVLKAHTLADVTLTLKNMMGLAPPAHYQQGNGWKKTSFHRQIDLAVADLNRYRTPDFTLLEASTGMTESHLGGPTCDPPPGLLAAGFDPVAIDAYGAGLLGKNWQDIGHIRNLHNDLGQAEPLNIIKTDEYPS